MRRRAGKIDFGLSSQSHIASTTLNELSGTFNVNVVTNFFEVTFDRVIIRNSRRAR